MLEIINSGLVTDSYQKQVEHLWYHLRGPAGPYYRVVALHQLTSIPVSLRQDYDLLGKQWAALRGLHNARVNFLYSAAGIFQPEHIGVVQFYGAAADGPNLELARQQALNQLAAVRATLANFPQSQTAAPEPRWVLWYIDFLTRRAGQIRSLLGYPDPRETRRGLGKDGEIPNQTADDLAAEQNELLFRGLAKLRQDFVFQVTASHFSSASLTRALMTVSRLGSVVASRQRGSLNFGFSLGIPLMAALSQALSGSTSQALSHTTGAADGITASQSQAHTDSYAYSENQSHSVGGAEAHSTAIGHSTGTAASQSQGRAESQSLTLSESQTHSQAQSVSHGLSQSQGLTVSEGTAIGTSQSQGQSANWSEGQSSNWSQGQQQSAGQAVAENWSAGTSQSSMQGGSEGSTWGSAETTSTGQSSGSSETVTASSSQGTNWSEGDNWNVHGSVNGSVGGSLGVPGVAAANASMGTSVGGGVGGSTSQGGSETAGQASSQATSASESTGTAQSESTGGSQGTSWGSSIGSSQGVGGGVTQSNTQGTSSAVGGGTFQSEGGGVSSSTSESQVHSQGIARSEGQAETWGTAQTTGQASSQGQAVSQGQTVSQGQAQTQSETQSITETNTQTRSWSATRGTAETWGQSDTLTQTQGRSHTGSQSTGLTAQRTGGQGFSGGFSTGLMPALSIGRSWHTEDDVAIRLTEVLRQLEAQLNQASIEGGFMTDAVLFTADLQGATAAEALVPQAFHGPNVPTPVMTIQPAAADQGLLRRHAVAFAPWAGSMPNDPFGGLLWTRYATLLTAGQVAAYTAPGLYEEGPATTVIAPIPEGMGFYPEMPGDVLLGHQYAPTTHELTNAPVRLDQQRLFHTMFAGDTGFGKSVAAMRMAYETTTRWHTRTVVLDFGAGWRALLNADRLKDRVDILQLWPDAVRPLRWNPLQIGRHIDPETQWRAFADIFGSIARLGVRRQKQELLEALRKIYLRAGVLVDDPEVRKDLEWGRVANQAEAALAGFPVGTSLGILVRMERQKIAVLRSSQVGLADLYQEIQAKLATIPPRDTMLSGVLEGILFRMNALVQGAAAAQFAPGTDTVPMEDLSKPWGITIIEGGMFLDDFGKAFLLGWAGWHLYTDMVARRVHAVNPDEPLLQIFFEEANKIFAGVDGGDDETGGVSASQRFGDMFRDARKYNARLHVITQAPSLIPQDIISSCNNQIVGFLKNPADKDIVLSALARSEKGFRDEDWRRFLSDLGIGMAIGRFPYTGDRRLQNPILFRPLMPDFKEPTDAEIERQLGRIVI